ncbi:hypothetical protein QWI17_11885 [Gilvimarinus sp. SDUM040013]|uniref:Uncharacterized protein n=1 Tax=Gilvimarinus gilvus TaxID=3058038 RepID=A0ABU4RW64_9GAMM|nr:hypothetical protein [Gilvimarinus sp. SDUM040013]MDO3386536.1 hypothetical protein [Gilvimarinus sp. SDUM040013]MDX6849112.1 hypothetical protein [Gilvimarinus sp. SDUM040013]
MRLFAVCFLIIALLGCQASQPTKSQSSSGLVILGLIFGITQDESLSVSEVRLARVEDVGSKSTIEYELEPHLMEQAVFELTEMWSGKKSDYEPGNEFFVICIYTNIEPDDVGCRSDQSGQSR